MQARQNTDMEKFYRTHQYLLEHTTGLVKRSLEQEVNWNCRMIGIKGVRGIGKTAFLLHYAQTRFSPNDRTCLYINLNNFYFTNNTLLEFIKSFSEQKGRVLLLDQVYKYPNWSEELSKCYTLYPDVQIIFTSSSVVGIKEENAHLEGIVDFYNLRGLSFREYLNNELKIDIPSYTLEEVLADHETITRNIRSQIDPLIYIGDYFHHGYYPLYLEKSNYTENLLKMINFMIEVDICYLKQIEMKYLPKLRKLFYILAKQSPCTINITALSKEIATSRATVLNYLKYMKEARIFNLRYPQGEEAFNKPERVYLDNTNLMYLMNESADKATVAETFFYNMIHKDHRIKSLPRRKMLEVDEKWNFEIRQKGQNTKHQSDYLILDGATHGRGHTLPLWVFGFLY